MLFSLLNSRTTTGHSVEINIRLTLNYIAKGNIKGAVSITRLPKWSKKTKKKQ